MDWKIGNENGDDMKILVADDSEDYRELLLDILPGWGYEVECVPDGAAAWRTLSRRDAPRLAILDWMMPELDGVTLCRRLRAQEQGNPCYIILLTSRNQPSDLVHALRAGADDFVTKPFNIDELGARIQVGCRVLGLLTQLSEHERSRGVLQMAGAVAHEMNQPLQTILTSIQLLTLDLPAADPNQEVLTVLKDAVKRLGQVTHRVMNITHGHTKQYLSEHSEIVDLSHTT